MSARLQGNFNLIRNHQIHGTIDNLLENLAIILVKDLCRLVNGSVQEFLVGAAWIDYEPYARSVDS